MRILIFLTLAVFTAASLTVGYLYWRIHRYDSRIAKASQAFGVDPSLIRAVIWRESRFNSRCIGDLGEIGLMQVTQDAAKEWAAANGVTSFVKRDLFNPEINIQAGTWYLRRAIRHWSDKANPLPYALAEYNAGRSNAKRWASTDGGDANRFRVGITYPSTRRYIRDVLNDYRRFSAAESNCMSYSRR